MATVTIYECMISLGGAHTLHFISLPTHYCLPDAEASFSYYLSSCLHCCISYTGELFLCNPVLLINER